MKHSFVVSENGNVRAYEYLHDAELEASFLDNSRVVTYDDDIISSKRTLDVTIDFNRNPSVTIMLGDNSASTNIKNNTTVDDTLTIPVFTSSLNRSCVLEEALIKLGDSYQYTVESSPDD